jgi:hypothetical protein
VNSSWKRSLGPAVAALVTILPGGADVSAQLTDKKQTPNTAGEGIKGAPFLSIGDSA